MKTNTEAKPVAVSKEQQPAAADAQPEVKAVEQPTDSKALSKNEKELLERSKKAIKESFASETSSFVDCAKASFAIQDGKLYRESHATLEGFFRSEFGIERSHAYRMARAGEIIERVSPRGDTWQLLTSEAHFRPLGKLEDAEQDSVLAVVEKWTTLAGQKKATPKLVEAAVSYVNPPAQARPTVANPLVMKLQGVIAGGKGKLPKTAGKDVQKIFAEMEKKAEALAAPKRTTGIDWTDATWNPLYGCSVAGPDCANCYAAKLFATRFADRYPGLAEEKKGKYMFNGTIHLLPEQLAKPLQDLTPKRYFVNSLSDLFHKNVPEDYIKAVFDVMEKAPWHQFQVLTKRPDRMAKFTTERYAKKSPPEHIWLGASAGNQERFDEIYPDLIKVKTAVRWLSLEPLIGAVKPASLDEIHWVVVGGESGSDRKMEKEWATALRDQCAKAKVPFYFKQWGAFKEDGTKGKKEKKDGLTPATLDGVVHDAYPAARATQEAEAEAAPAKKPAPKGKMKAKKQPKEEDAAKAA